MSSAHRVRTYQSPLEAAIASFHRMNQRRQAEIGFMRQTVNGIQGQIGDLRSEYQTLQNKQHKTEKEIRRQQAITHELGQQQQLLQKNVEGLKHSQVQMAKDMNQGFANVQRQMGKMDDKYQKQFQKVNQNINRLEHDMVREFSNVRSEMHTGFNQVHDRMTREIHDVREDMDQGFRQVNNRVTNEINQVYGTMNQGFNEVHNRMDREISQVYEDMNQGFNEVYNEIGGLRQETADQFQEVWTEFSSVRQDMSAMDAHFTQGLNDLNASLVQTRIDLSNDIQVLDQRFTEDLRQRIETEQNQFKRAQIAAEAALELVRDITPSRVKDLELDVPYEQILSQITILGDLMKTDPEAALATAKILYANAFAFIKTFHSRANHLYTLRDFLLKQCYECRNALEGIRPGETSEDKQVIDRKEIIDYFFSGEKVDLLNKLQQLEHNISSSYNQWNSWVMQSRIHQKVLDKMFEYIKRYYASFDDVKNMHIRRQENLSLFIEKFRERIGTPLNLDTSDDESLNRSFHELLRYSDKNDKKSAMGITLESDSMKADCIIDLDGAMFIDGYGASTDNECHQSTAQLVDGLQTEFSPEGYGERSYDNRQHAITNDYLSTDWGKWRKDIENIDAGV